MRFTPLISNDDLRGIEVSHGSELIRFTLEKNNGKRSFTKLPIIFNAVNSLLSTLSENEQEAMYHIYEDIHELTLHKVDGDEFGLLIEDLQLAINGIFALLPLEGIRLWSANSYSDFKIPETIGTTITPGNYPKSTSYNQLEYLELCGLSTIFKLLIPITFGFMREFKNVFDTDFKEFNMMFLFKDLELENFAPFTKLLDQAKSVIEVRGEIEVPMGLLLNGVGQDYYPLFSIATCVIRTLCLSETDVAFRNDGVPNNITAKLTKAIKKNIETNKKVFSYANKELPNDKDLSGEGGNTSNQEGDQSIQRFSDLYSRFFVKALDRDDFHKRYGIDNELHEIFRAHVKNHPPTIDINKMVLCGLCFPNYANVESFTLVPMQTMRKVVINAAAYMHQLGLYSLVNYLLAREDNDGGSTSINKYVASESKPNKDILAQAKELYEETDDGSTGLDSGLRDLVVNICKSDWIKLTPPNLHDSYGINEEWIGDKNLKDHILMLILASHNQQYKTL